MDVLATCDGHCNQPDHPRAKAGKHGQDRQAPRSNWDDEALVSCTAVEDGVKKAVANANRGGKRVSDAVLLNHQLLQHARQGNVRGLNEALDKGAWTETRRPLVMKPQKPDVGGKKSGQGEVDQGMTALMFASQACSVECVRSLIRSHAEVNAREEDGWSSLMFAAKEASLEVCQALLEARADPHFINCDEKTALQLAIDEEEDNGDFAKQFKKLVDAHDEAH